MDAWIERPARSIGGGVPLALASPVKLWASEELDVLGAVCWLGVQRGDVQGIRRAALRSELSMGRRQLTRHLRRLVIAGALEAVGAWTGRTHRLTDAGVATYLAHSDHRSTGSHATT